MAVDQGSGQAAPLYHVTHVDDSTMLGQTGGYQRSKKVYFTLLNGTSSFVEIPLSGFTKANVEQLIERHVGDLLDVLNIQGALVPPLPS